MADVSWVARAQKTAQINTITPANVNIGNTFTVTISQKAYTFTATAATVANVTAGLVALLTASEEPEFTEVTWTDSTTHVTGTANTPGTPFTQTSSATGGTATLTTATATANSSPNDVNNVKNWSGGALPTTGDNVFIDGEYTQEPLLWNLGQLAAVVLGTVTRRRSFNAQVSLPEWNENGYREYRSTEFAFEAAAVVWEQSSQDTPAMHKLNIGSGTACTVRIEGQGNSALADEPLWLRGTNASNALQAVGGSVAIATLAGQTAVFATVVAQQSTIRTAAGTTWGTSITLRDCTFESASNLPATFQMYGDAGTTDLRGTATGTAPIVDGGTFYLNSSGAVSAPAIRTNATLDLSGDARAKSITGTMTMHAGASFLDPMSRCAAGTVTIQCVGCEWSDITIVMGPGRTAAFS